MRERAELPEERVTTGHEPAGAGLGQDGKPRRSSGDLRRTKKVRTQFMARDARDPFDVGNAPNRNFVPLQYGCGGDAQASGQLAGAADAGKNSIEWRSMCVHASDIS